MARTLYAHSCLYKMTDEELVQQFKQGDDEAMTVLVERYYSDVLAMAQARIPDGYAEDVAQDVFLRLCRSVRGFRRDSTFKTWFAKLKNGAVIDFFRWWYRYNRLFSFTPYPMGPKCYQDHAELEFMDATKALPKHYREVLFLYHYARYDMKEVAEIQGWTWNQAWAYEKRARKRLQEAYDGQNR